MILIVDDDDGIREGVASFLRLEGHRVLQAANGQEALEILHSGEHIRVVFSDINMPVLDGRELCQERLLDPMLLLIPVFLVSGEQDIAETARDVGATGYIKKPVDIDELLAVVGRYPRRST